MKYLILIHINQASRAIWDLLPAEQRAAGFHAHDVLNEQLEASGELVLTEALADPSSAVQVTVRDGRAVTTDGPFSELKEQLAGIYLLECDSLERAIEVAASMPEASDARIEVRAVLDRRGLEM